ncbi:MAG TPA: UdgX family uracil-DNA binding protein [Gemmatimonadaceae bacterium]|nr:UdgX family uracil-DNA binding protein [Gemmatimonadaceae bacterium]
MTTAKNGASNGAASQRGGTGSAAAYIPARATLSNLRDAAARCRGCDLWTCGRVVFGEGPKGATVMFVGEQPGDQEEQMGHPFVGPAGKVLDAALENAGIDRKSVYLTNAVKHFKYERGAKSKRRIHKKPNDAEIRACHPWLEKEIEVIKPRVIVVLGAVAAQSLLGKQFRVTQQRGKPVKSSLADTVIATVHPSSVLRAPDDERAQARRDFFADIRAVAKHMAPR